MKCEIDLNNPPPIPPIFFGEEKEKELFLKRLAEGALPESDKILLTKIFKRLEEFVDLIKRDDKDQ